MPRKWRKSFALLNQDHPPHFKLLGWNASYSAPFISIEKASPQLKVVLHTSYPGASPSYITESLTTKTLWRIYVNCIRGPSYSKFRYKGGHYGIRRDTPHPLDEGQNCGFWSTRILPYFSTFTLSSILRPSVTGMTSHILFSIRWLRQNKPHIFWKPFTLAIRCQNDQNCTYFYNNAYLNNNPYYMN